MDNQKIFGELEEALDNFPLVWDDLETANSEEQDALDEFDTAWYAMRDAFAHLWAALEPTP